ncbi:MAG: hypothetical protein GY851_31245 [bacterium]|nr:hypothetical protein [bacterium]
MLANAASVDGAAGRSVLSGSFVVYVPIGVAVVGAVAVVAWALRARSRAVNPPGSRNAFECVCSVCQREIVVPVAELDPLAPVEVALCGRTKPQLIGRKLGQYDCPHCEASHYFTMDTRPPQWVGVNLYSPQDKTCRCQECGRVLQPSPWGKGMYDGRLHEAPRLQPDFGLVCAICSSVSCVDCVETLAHEETSDGSHVCPRCRRRSVHSLFSG